MSETTRNQREWENAANWSRWGSYRSAKDTRVFVPNRIRFFLWTINFAHPQAYLWLCAVLFGGGVMGGVLGVVVSLCKEAIQKNW